MEVTALKKPNLRLVVNNQPNEVPEEVVYEITKDPALLNQYYKLREECYRQDLGLKNFSGAEDEYDRVGIIVVARVGRKVVGGARMVMSVPNNHTQLPLESDGFVMKELFPELELDRHGYFEIGRLAINDFYRDAYVTVTTIKTLCDEAVRKGCCFQFIISSIVLFRSHRLTLHKLGYRHILLPEVAVPKRDVYERINDLGIYLSITYLKEELNDKAVAEISL